MAGQSSDNDLERRASQVSTASRRSTRNGTRKHSLVTPTSAKTLESFPSLSPDASPSNKPEKQFLASPPPRTPNETSHRSSKHSPSIVESLITSTPSFRGRSALFEDSPKSNKQDVPGSLHLSSDADIRQLIKKNGAVALVRRLAEDVAQRDVEITAFRRRAEERERELKRMLREVEVSNLDIETRLHRLDHDVKDTFKLKNPPQKSVVRSPSGKDWKDRIPGITNGIDDMLGEAMEDDVGRLSAELDEGYLDSLAETDKHATLKARSLVLKESDGRSIASSVDSQGRPRSTIRGWKDYLWNNDATSGKASRASSVVSEYDQEVGAAIKARGHSGSNGRRKGLDEDLFSPPTRTLTTRSSTTEHSRRSSNSIASWTMKLFAGNTQAGRDADKQGMVRGRSSTTGSGQSRNSGSMSTASAPVPTTAKAALMKVNNMEPSTRSPRKSVQPLALGTNVAPKATSHTSNMILVTSPNSANVSTNLGPVEMDTIHPADSKPPTLTQINNKNDGSSDLLTDRFGFIYDQRRRKKAAEIAKGHARGKSNASANLEMIGGVRDSLKVADSDKVSVHSKANSVGRPETPASNDDRAEDKPTKRWQDYLKVATFPTELLSHTPSAKPVTPVISPDLPSPRLKRAPTGGDSRSLPSTSINLEPEMSPVTAGNAEIVQSSLSPESAQTTSTSMEEEPVKLLLTQLTELHDTLQREKTIKWNEFLRKVRAERKREGETAAGSDARSKQVMPEVTLTDGEMIGVAGLGNKGKVGQAKWKEFKQLVLGGIPVAYRAKIWAECSGASALRVPGYYDDLVASDMDDPTIVAQIQMDIHRTLTDNIFFRKGPGVAKLNEVLLAYARRNPEVGYCQGMNLIAGSLLLIMPTAEDAFWVLTSMIENILPRHYYDHSLLASRADQQVLRQYVTEILPKLSAHLDELGIELEALTFQWFLSVFTDCLSAEALFRVWDVVLCFNDGSTFLFQVALALLKLNEQQLLECDSAARVYGYIGNEMTDHAISIDGLVSASDALKREVRRGEVEERRWRAVEEERGRERGRGRRGESGGSSAELSVREPRPFEEEVGGGG